MKTLSGPAAVFWNHHPGSCGSGACTSRRKEDLYPRVELLEYLTPREVETDWHGSTPQGPGLLGCSFDGIERARPTPPRSRTRRHAKRELGFSQSAIVHEPDGHAMHLIQR